MLNVAIFSPETFSRRNQNIIFLRTPPITALSPSQPPILNVVDVDGEAVPDLELVALGDGGLGQFVRAVAAVDRLHFKDLLVVFEVGLWV